MGQSLTQIAQQLKASNKKVQLIYAFNGSGKTRRSPAALFQCALTPRACGVNVLTNRFAFGLRPHPSCMWG